MKDENPVNSAGVYRVFDELFSGNVSAGFCPDAVPAEKISAACTWFFAVHLKRQNGSNVS